MTRPALGLFALAVAACGLGPAADPAPAKTAAVPVELVLLDGDKAVRVELVAEVDGVPVSAVWSETFAKLFAYCDRNGDGSLDAAEAARLPSARALRQAMGNGFVPPAGATPAFADLDRDADGKVTAAELAAHYRSASVGNVVVGVGRLPAGADLTAALVKHLDASGDGKVDEKEWRAAAEALRKLDKNDDELIGAGELVPGAVYPGAAGAVLLTPPAAGVESPDAAKLPLVRLPEDRKDAHWAAELARRNPRLNADDLTALRAQPAAARWTVRLTDTPAGDERFGFVVGGLRVDGWVATGTATEVQGSARTQIAGLLGAPESEEGAKKKGRGGAGGLAWLRPLADRNGDGELDRGELDAWLDLQAQVARGQVLVTVLDGAGLFELLDVNHDGALSVRELRGAWDRVRVSGWVTGGAFDPAKLPRGLVAAASRGYPKTLATAARGGPPWFRAMDRNGDGDVSRREFTGPADVFRRLDLDADGLLSPDEADRAGSKN